MEGNNKPKSEINLRKLMQKLGLGTNAFAEKCGMSSQSMSQFLRNKSLTTNTIYRIATALDIDPRDMFFPTDEDDIFSNAENDPLLSNCSCLAISLLSLICTFISVSDMAKIQFLFY